jgi:hypothetical protein
MTTNLTGVERQILLGIMDDECAALAKARLLRRVRAEGFTGYRRIQHFRSLAEAEAAPIQGVRVDLGGWLETEATPDVRQKGGRALARLAAAGLIDRTADGRGGRLTHALLTAVGRGVIAEWLKARFTPEELARPPKKEDCR